VNVPALDRRTTVVGIALAESAQDFVCRAYEQERDVIYRYLVSLGVGPETAQDLSQETFLRLYAAIRNGESIRTLRAWLFTVASRLALKDHRAQARMAPLDDARYDAWRETAAATGLTSEQALIEQQRLRALREGLATLSRQQQICVHLRSEGLRYREIAGVLGVSVPTVAEFLRRAIARLRRALHD
jgi:RNA polymerase sigma-70 factor (ECF subfamily)